jgi:hypothetical protein
MIGSKPPIDRFLQWIFRTFQDSPRTGTGFGDTVMLTPTGPPLHE